jgi:indole-3-glycerol phosphate synthase
MEIEMSTQRISKPDILAKIEVYKRQEILLAKQKTSVDAMRKLARQAPTPRGFAAAIESHLSSRRPALIAEIKKASPSKGLIRPDFDPPALACLCRRRSQLSFGSNR